MTDHKHIYFEYTTDFLPNYGNREDLFGYFHADIFARDECINCLITMYDEEGDELVRTLASLGDAFKSVIRPVRIAVIQDGWCRAKPSMKELIQTRIFPHVTSDAWDALQVPGRTYVMQAVDDFTGDLLYTDINTDIKLAITLIIKTDNRQKHNSQSWFLRAFCKEYPSLYLFTTDVGTTYHPQSLSRLEVFMDRNSGVSGCHGYPWVAKISPDASWMQRYIRAIQEYELGPLASDHDRGFQSLFGFQQTLSGPCCFMRSEDATYASLLAFISAIFDRDVSEFNIFSSNLNIVEDTAMSLYLFASSGKALAIVPDAYYYYDVETVPARFLAQRRRWMNGVACGLLIFWKTYHKILARSLHSPWIQRFVRFTLAFGICNQVIFPFLQPILFAYAIFQSFNPNFCSYYPHVLRSFQETALRPYFPWSSLCFTALYVCWFVIWVTSHSLASRSFHVEQFWITFILTHTLCLYSFYTVLAITIHVAFYLIPLWQRPIVSTVIGAYYVSPAIISLIKRDWRTLATSTYGIIPYLSFFPFWTFVYGYNIARLWDVTWGNRVGMLDEQTKLYEKQIQYKNQANRLTHGYLIAFVTCCGGICYASLTYNASYLHAVYVVPWYLLSSIMGVCSIIWTCKYKTYREKKQPTAIFRQTTFKRLNRYFTFGRDKSKYII